MSSSRLTEFPKRPAAFTWLVASVLGAVAFLFSMATFNLSNDHFGRISPARQIAQYGDLPFRDFLDPGYLLAELSSAVLQRLLGDNLIGEALLSCGFVACGTVFVWLLARRVSGSSLVGLVAAVLALLFLPRSYDYDKVLFYPLGLFLAWRYVEKPSAASVWALAAGLVAAGLYRYDTAVYIAVVGAVSMAVVHAHEWSVLAKRLALLGGASLCLALPALVSLQLNGGLANAVDQMVTYGRRETARTRLVKLPKLSVGRIVSVVDMAPPSYPVLVRWASSVDDAARGAAEARHRLLEGRPSGSREERTWEYRVTDASSASLRALMLDPSIVDTGGIDRARVTLKPTPEPLWTRLMRAVPLLRVRLFPGAWHEGNANAFLYHLFRLLPLLAASVLLIDARSRALASVPEIARLTGLVTLCVALNVFIMREPVPARIGGMAGPAVVLAAWMVWRVSQVERAATRVGLKIVVTFALLVTVWSISASANWRVRIRPEMARPNHLAHVVEMLAASPPSLEAMPQKRELLDLVQYLRECTSSRQRVFVTWFAPEVYFFAQRGFAGGVAVLFGEHWSEPRFVNRVVEMLAAQSPPIVVTRAGDDSLRKSYPRLSRYLDEHYQVAGDSGAADVPHGGDQYVVHRLREGNPSQTYGESNLPCFR